MKQFIYILLVLVFASSIVSNRNGRASSTGLGSTGAPGDDATVCRSCHNGPISVAVDLFILDHHDTISEYEPNKSYNIHVLVRHTGGNDPVAHGFQLTGLLAPLNQIGPNITSLEPFSANVKSAMGRNGRLYLEHRDRSADSLFVIKWTSPPTGSGPVSFYAGGTGVNANNTSSGDGGNRKSIEVNEKSSSASVNLTQQKVKVFPNPFQQQVQIKSEVLIETITVKNLLGNPIIKSHPSAYVANIDLGTLPDGIYFLQCMDSHQNTIKTTKLVKRNMQP